MNRFLSLVFMLAALPLLALAALLIKISIPTPDGGMEPTMAFVCYLAVTVIFGALITVVVNFSIQLGRQAKGAYTTP